MKEYINSVENQNGIQPEQNIDVRENATQTTAAPDTSLREALTAKAVEDMSAKMKLSEEDLKEVRGIAARASEFSRNIDQKELEEVNHLYENINTLSKDELNRIPMIHSGLNTMPIVWNKFIDDRNQYIDQKLAGIDQSQMSAEDISKLKAENARDFDLKHSEITADSDPLRVRDILNARKTLRGSLTATEGEMERLAVQALGSGKFGASDEEKKPAQQAAFKREFAKFMADSKDQKHLEYDKLPMTKEEFLVDKLKYWTDRKKYRDIENENRARKVQALELGLDESSTKEQINARLKEIADKKAAADAKAREAAEAKAQRNLATELSDWKHRRAAFVEVAAARASTEWGRNRLRAKFGKQFDESEPMPGGAPSEPMKKERKWNKPSTWFRS